MARRMKGRQARSNCWRRCRLAARPSSLLLPQATKQSGTTSRVADSPPKSLQGNGRQHCPRALRPTQSRCISSLRFPCPALPRLPFPTLASRGQSQQPDRRTTMFTMSMSYRETETGREGDRDREAGGGCSMMQCGAWRAQLVGMSVDWIALQLNICSSQPIALLLYLWLWGSIPISEWAAFEGDSRAASCSTPLHSTADQNSSGVAYDARSHLISATVTRPFPSRAEKSRTPTDCLSS